MHQHWTDEASWSEFIISHLLSWGSLKIQKSILYELVQKRRKLGRQAFNNNLYRLQKKGILNFDASKDIIINKKVLESCTLFRNIEEKPIGDQKVMVLFDVPEKKRKMRNWLRSQLKLWDFEILQQSVWMGKGLLPKEFTKRLRLMNIYDGVKIFRIQNIRIQK